MPDKLWRADTRQYAFFTVAVLLSEAAASEEKKDYTGEHRARIKAVGLAPENYTMLLKFGSAYRRLGSYEKAIPIMQGRRKG